MSSYKSTDIVIIGGCAGALIAYEIISYEIHCQNIYFLEYFFDKSKHSFNKPVTFLEGNIDSNLDLLKRDNIKYFVATGDNHLRKQVTEQLIDKIGKYPINVISSRSCITPSSKMGYGNLILAGSIVHTNAFVGNGCIINTNAIVEHDNILGDYCQISPGATLCGYVEIGTMSFISANSTVIPKVKITNDVLVGAGSVVTKDITESNSLYVGVPAKLKKKYESKYI